MSSLFLSHIWSVPKVMSGISVAQPTEQTSLPLGDALRGIAKITRFLCELLDEELEEKTVYRWIDSGLIPCGKLGPRQLIASKTTIAAAISSAARGQ